MFTIDDATRAWFGERYWREDELLRDARDAFAQTGPLIEVPRDAAAALAMLVRVSGARRIVEIGTLFGYSATTMARVLPADGTIDTLELLDAHADAAQRLFERAGVASQITIHRGAALERLAELDGPYDLAFIDADKEGYVDYAMALIPRMRVGGVIVADNVAAGNHVSDAASHDRSAEHHRAYHELISTHPRLASNVLAVGDGLAVSVVLDG